MITPSQIKVRRLGHSREGPFIPKGSLLIEGAITFPASVLLDRFVIEGVDLRTRDETIAHAEDVVRRRIWRDIYPEIEMEKLAQDYVRDFYSCDKHGFPDGMLNPEYRDRVLAIGNYCRYPL